MKLSAFFVASHVMVWIQQYHILKHTASQTEGSSLPTQHRDNVTARPSLLVTAHRSLLSVPCQLSQLSRHLEQGDSKTMDCTHEDGRGEDGRVRG